MASETATSPSNDNMAASAEAGEGADRPLLDMSDDAVQTMIKRARQRGFVTHGEINAVLSSQEVTSERIEDVLAMLHEMGISTVEQDESESEPAATGEATTDDDERRRRRPGRDGPPPPGRGQEARGRRAHHRPGAPVSSRHGRRTAPVARRRDRGRQAHRGRPRGDDRRPVRKPAQLPGHHRLARRAQSGKGPAARHHRSRGDLCGAGRRADADADARSRCDAGRRIGAAAAARRARDGARGAGRPGRGADRAGRSRSRRRR